MFENEKDSQLAYGLSRSIPSESDNAGHAVVDPWFQQNQIELSISKIERLPQSFVRVAQFFRDGSYSEGQKLLKHCLETASQLFNQWPLNVSENDPATNPMGLIVTMQRRNETVTLIREICAMREINDFDAIADSIEDELVVKLRTCESLLRQLARKISQEIY